MCQSQGVELLVGRQSELQGTELKTFVKKGASKHSSCGELRIATIGKDKIRHRYSFAVIIFSQNVQHDAEL